MIPARRPIRILAASAAAAALRGLTIAADLLPPRLRFGHWNRLMRLLSFGATLPAIPRCPQPPAPANEPAAVGGTTGRNAVRCTIVAGDLDNGGVEAVIAALARGLPWHGVEVEVVCTSAGRVAEELRADGVKVFAVAPGDLSRFLTASHPDAVQLHRVDASLFAALDGVAERTVPVFHAMESYLDAPTWDALGGLVARAPLSVCVSDSVRSFFAARVTLGPTRVIVNGAPPIASRIERSQARALLAQAIGVDLGGDLVVAGLQRFSDQKNALGLVDAFLLASERLPGARLVIAGAPDSWLEYRRADALRRLHPHGDRVHLLGDSDPRALLSAADVFALDSFAEGGPLAAVEAACFGLPVVLSDVGFARELLEAGAPGAVVPRANADWSAASMARERRRRHQRNRAAFADALVAVSAAEAGRRQTPVAPPRRFTLDAMVAGHAAALREVAASAVPAARLASRA